MKKIIITGALGQDGFILSKILLKNKYKVFGIIKNNKKNTIKNVSYIKLNLSNLNLVKRKFDKIKPDVIVHFASENPSINENIKKTLFLKNIKNTTNIIDYVKKNKNIKLIYSNSSQIYSNKIKKVNEKSKFKDTNYYTKYRIQSARYLLKLKKKFNLNCTNLILFNHDSKYRNKKFLLPRLVIAFKKKNYKFIKSIYSNNIKMDFSHADDICNAIYLLIKKNKNPDNLILSSGKLTSINKLITKYVDNNLLNKVKFKKPKIGLIGNNNKAQKILGWKLNKNLFDAAKEIYLNK
tara:strand:- start:54 stop:935 length:882 start_codon:yes stop_codon:yes gene_type:complete